MSSRTVVLDEEHFRVAEEKARALGTTTDEFVNKLIEAHQALVDESFDILLAGVRKGFDSVGDDELDQLFTDAKARISDSNLK